jgi:hypothetical protein
MKIEKIEKVPLRDIWKHEAQEFTKWLQDNIDVLGDVLDIHLSNVEREQSTGTFNVDLKAEDDDGKLVIIENQLGKSNHDHLGKIITYLTAVEASKAIWIVSEPRPEHIGAIAWLNESTPAEFYLLKIEGIKIGNSSPAPLLTLIVGPSAEAKEAGVTKKEIAERFSIRHNFWAKLLERAKSKTKLHEIISPSSHGWVSTGAGKRGLSYVYSITQHEGKVELYIDRGKESEDENKKIFDDFISHKDEIEKSFGDKLNWERLENKRACRISKSITTGGYRDPEKWDSTIDNMIAAMISLEKALAPIISKMKI